MSERGICQAFRWRDGFVRVVWKSCLCVVSEPVCHTGLVDTSQPISCWWILEWTGTQKSGNITFILTVSMTPKHISQALHVIKYKKNSIIATCLPLIASLHQIRIHTASDELDSAGWRGLIHSTLRHAQYSVGSMMDHWGCKSMAWSTPIDHNVRFFSVLISLASQVANYLENIFILFKSKYISTERLTPTWFKVQLLHSSCVYGSAPRTAAYH